MLQPPIDIYNGKASFSSDSEVDEVVDYDGNVWIFCYVVDTASVGAAPWIDDDDDRSRMAMRHARKAIVSGFRGPAVVVVVVQQPTISGSGDFHAF